MRASGGGSGVIRWCHQEQRGRTRGDQAHEVLRSRVPRQFGNARAERRDEQECEQHLHAGPHGPHLLQQLDEIAIATLGGFVTFIEQRVPRAPE
jgi:hypothetical protein